MGALDGAIHTLSALEERYGHGNDDEEGFTPLIEVVADIGRALARPDYDEFHEFLPYVAALRERLEYGGKVANTPWDALREDKSSYYAAGSLWACSAIINGYLRQARDERRRSRERSTRTEVRDVALEMLEGHDGPVRPADILAECDRRAVEASPSTVSKALGDLLEQGIAEASEPPMGSDRRHRYYTVAQPTATLPAGTWVRLTHVLEEVESSIEQLNRRLAQVPAEADVDLETSATEVQR